VSGLGLSLGVGLSAPVAGGGGGGGITEWTLVEEQRARITSGSSPQVFNFGTLAQGDIVIVARACDDPIVAINTAGYTQIYASGGNVPGAAIHYKVMGETPDTSISIQQTFRVTAGVIQVWRGVDTVTPIDAAATSASNTSGNPNPPSYTTVTDGALLFAVGFLDDDAVRNSVTPPSGFTNLIAEASQDGDAASTVHATVMMSSLTVPTAGATDPTAYATAGDDSWHAACFALRPSF
jgi:hypothetical protein